VQTSVNDTIDNVRGEVTGRVDAAREAFEAGRQAARDTRDDLERRVSETRARVRHGVDAARQPATGDPVSAENRGVRHAEPDTDLGV
jgi:hypothetical protein